MGWEISDAVMWYWMMPQATPAFKHSVVQVKKQYRKLDWLIVKPKKVEINFSYETQNFNWPGRHCQMLLSSLGDMIVSQWFSALLVCGMSRVPWKTAFLLRSTVPSTYWLTSTNWKFEKPQALSLPSEYLENNSKLRISGLLPQRTAAHTCTVITGAYLYVNC